MIRIQLTDTLLPSIEGQCTMLEAPTIIAPAVVNDAYCLCDCEYEELVFSETGAIVSEYKNDKTDLIFIKAISSDTITIKMYKDTDDPKTISDNTYGTYYSTFTAQPLYVGFVADWNKIYNSLGAGLYYFEITKTIMGVETTVYTPDYRLRPYTDLGANGTVRIETYNSGSILNSDFDYDGLLTGGWYQSMRINGKLLAKVPKLQVDNYIDQNYNVIQRQDRISNEWELITGLLPANISNKLLYDMLLADRILVSDYNIYSEENIKQLELIKNGNVEKKSFNKNQKSNFSIKFTDKKLDGIKNNY